MSKLESFVQRNFVQILLAFLVASYLLLLGELALYQHWDGVQLIGFLATVLGLLCVLAGFFVKGAMRKGVIVVLLLLSLTGLFGTYEHFESRNEEKEGAVPAALQAERGSGNMTVAYRPGAVAKTAMQEQGEAGESGEKQEAERSYVW